MNGEDIGNMEYIEIVSKYLKKQEVNIEVCKEASKLVANAIDNDGIIYLFGCGHSHIFGEEVFYRAGGLANVCPILYEPLMLHHGAAQSSVNEKKNDYIGNFIDQYKLTENDVLFVISTSGINPVPIDVAKYGKECGAKVITLSSFAYTTLEKSRHNLGYYLKDVGDINIDNHVLHGDAVIETKGIKHSPVSTVIGVSLLHQIISGAIELTSVEPLPVFISGNISGSKQHNQELVNKYKQRIPMLGMNLEE